MTDDRTADDTQNQEEEPPPELADWWVWGVRRVAAVIADFLHSVRFIPLVFILFKGAMWAFTRSRALVTASTPCKARVTHPRRAASLRRQLPVSSRHPASGAAESGRSAGIVSHAMAGIAGVKRISPVGPLMMRVMLSAKV